MIFRMSEIRHVLWRDGARTPSSEEQDISPSDTRGRESSEKGFQVKGPVIAQGSSASKSTNEMNSLLISIAMDSRTSSNFNLEFT